MASHEFSAWSISPQYLLHLNFSTGQCPESCPLVNHIAFRSLPVQGQKAALLQPLRVTHCLTCCSHRSPVLSDAFRGGLGGCLALHFV